MDAQPEPQTVVRLPRERLRGFERFSVAVCDWINLNRKVKDFVQVFVSTWTAGWIGWFGGRRWELHGLEHVAELEPPRGVILVANHRSFFDMYLTCAALYRHARFLDRIVFPVRSGFFYTNPLGLLVNLSISAGAMWPPVFRDERKTELNPLGLKQVVHVLREPGCVVGMHPEGTRGKGPDPYEFLPARPGLGRMLREAHPDTVVVPYFILGMSSRFADEIRYSLFPPKVGHRIRITFGAPMRAGDLDFSLDDVGLSEHLLDVVRELGAQDKARQQAEGLLPPEPDSGAPAS